MSAVPTRRPAGDLPRIPLDATDADRAMWADPGLRPADATPEDHFVWNLWAEYDRGAVDALAARRWAAERDATEARDMRQAADNEEAVSRERARRYARRLVDAEEREGADGETFARVDFAALLSDERPPRQWVVEGLISAGASVSFVAPAGERKSLILLGMCVGVARGDAEFAGLPIPQPRRVFYLDTENTEDDLRERLLSFGVRPGDDLSRLILVSLPSMAPLDTAQGGADLLEALDAYGLQPGDVVALDSFQRVTEGAENDSDTGRGYYRHTGAALKGRGLTVVRTDNTGKDVTRGARGSTGKRDDVDVEWLFSRTPGGVRLAVGKGRQRGIEPLNITVTDDGEGRTTFSSDRRSDPVTACMSWLDAQGIPRDESARQIEKRVRLAGLAATWPRDSVVREAVERRKALAEDFPGEL